MEMPGEITHRIVKRWTTTSDGVSRFFKLNDQELPIDTSIGDSRDERRAASGFLYLRAAVVDFICPGHRHQHHSDSHVTTGSSL